MVVCCSYLDYAKTDRISLFPTQALTKVNEEYTFLKDIKNELNQFKQTKAPEQKQDDSGDPDVWGPPPPKAECVLHWRNWRTCSLLKGILTNATVLFA